MQLNVVWSRAPRKAFTLVEILVVIVIIVVLAALLFPVFASAREKARASVCLSNYRQIGLAMQMYGSDDDGLIPSNGGSFGGLINDCQPYTRNTKIFRCPDDYDMEQEGRPGSYRIPTLYQGKPIDCGWRNPYGGGETRSSATTMVYEAEQDINAPIATTYRHSGGTQFLYFDGHTKWLKKPGTTGEDND